MNDKMNDLVKSFDKQVTEIETNYNKLESSIKDMKSKLDLLTDDKLSKDSNLDENIKIKILELLKKTEDKVEEINYSVKTDIEQLKTQTSANNSSVLDSIDKSTLKEKFLSSDKEIETLSGKVEDFIKEIKKNGRDINIEDIHEYLDQLSLLQESALFHLIAFVVLLTVIISISGVLFGNEIIKYFDLENKFPSLANFFKLRVKFKRYYLI